MKHSLTSRILLAGFALALMFIASTSEAKIENPTTLYLRRVDGAQNLVATSATINSGGTFTFSDVPPGKYELLIAGSQAYFTAKAAETGNTIILDFDWASNAGTQRDLISTSKSNIRHNGIAAPGGSGGDEHAGAIISTTRSNIKRQSCPINSSSVTSADVGGRTVYCQVIAQDIELTAKFSSPSGRFYGLQCFLHSINH